MISKFDLDVMPRDMRDLAARASQVGMPEAQVVELVGISKPALMVEERGARVDALDAGRTWIGGPALVPEDFDWPVANDEPQALIMQLDLDALPDLRGPLPSSGILQFFLDESTGWYSKTTPPYTTRWWPTGTRLVERADAFWMQERLVVDVVPVVTIPAWAGHFPEWGHAERQRYDELLDFQADLGWQIGGWPSGNPGDTSLEHFALSEADLTLPDVWTRPPPATSVPTDEFYRWANDKSEAIRAVVDVDVWELLVQFGDLPDDIDVEWVWYPIYSRVMVERDRAERLDFSRVVGLSK